MATSLCIDNRMAYRYKYAMLKIDEIDKDLLEEFNFYLHCGYYRTQESRKIARENNRKSRKWIHLHRVVMERMVGRELQYPFELVDHINGDTEDNRRKNLRIVSNAQNTRNRKGANRNSKTGFRGILKSKHNTYYARYRDDYLGSFKTLDEAVKAFKKAEHDFLNPSS